VKYTVLFLALALISPPERAAAGVEFDGADWHAEIDAHTRLLWTWTREIEADHFFETGSTKKQDSGLLLTRAEVTAEGVWHDRLYGQLVYDMEYRTGPGLESLRFAVGDEAGPGTWFHWDDTIHQSSSADMRHLIYRASLRYEGERFDVTIGRQRIALGRGRLWNPTDLFNPIFPLQIEGDRRVGQDAIVARLFLTDDLRLELIESPQNDPDDHRMAGRFALHRQEVDAAVMVARIREDYVFGGEFATSFRGAGIRGEATFTDPDVGDRFWQVVASVDRNIPIGNGLYVLAEHLFNENLVDPDAPIPPLLQALVLAQAPQFDRITTIAKNQTGLQTSYEITPLLRGNFVVLYDWNGASAAFLPGLSYAWRSDVEITLGGQLFVGRDREQYGDISNLVLLQVDAYF
jgi:hypothetical protein